MHKWVLLTDLHMDMDFAIVPGYIRIRQLLRHIHPRIYPSLLKMVNLIKIFRIFQNLNSRFQTIFFEGISKITVNAEIITPALLITPSSDRSKQ